MKAAERRRESEREILSIKSEDIQREEWEGYQKEKKQRICDISYQQQPRCMLIKDARAVRG